MCTLIFFMVVLLVCLTVFSDLVLFCTVISCSVVQFYASIVKYLHCIHYVFILLCVGLSLSNFCAFRSNMMGAQ